MCKGMRNRLRSMGLQKYFYLNYKKINLKLSTFNNSNNYYYLWLIISDSRRCGIRTRSAAMLFDLLPVEVPERLRLFGPGLDPVN